MNPFQYFKNFASAKGLQEFEKQLTEFLINNRLFQYFAYKSESAVKEAGEKIFKEATKATKRKDIPKEKKLKP